MHTQKSSVVHGYTEGLLYAWYMLHALIPDEHLYNCMILNGAAYG